MSGQGKLCGPVVEALPRRSLLSTTLSDQGLLAITGTEGNDRISIATTQFVNALVVDDNGAAHYYSLAAVKQISVNAGAGDDRVVVDAGLNAMGYSCSISGGAGDDVLTGAGKTVTINGEDGRDRIRSAATDSSTLNGGNGVDVIYGSESADSIYGNSGGDRIYGGAGDDYINSGKGNDIVHAGAGNDTIRDVQGFDSFYGDEGDDAIKALSPANVEGGDGNDTIVGTMVHGGGGNDTIYGLSVGDMLHGDGGDDLIKGGGGKDQIFGDTGNDALFGGSDSDQLHGGTGDDNLYGGDGHTDKNTDDDGHDQGFGEGGRDWFEPVHVWLKVDFNQRMDNPAQNNLSQDPSLGKYAANAGVRVLNSSGSGFTTVAGSVFSSGSTLQLSTTLGLFDNALGSGGDWPPANLAPAIEMKSLGDAGWLSSGAWDPAAATFVPAPLDAGQRAAVKQTFIQLPADWQVGAMSTARDNIVWYRLSLPASEVTVPSSLGLLGYYTLGTFSTTSLIGDTSTTDQWTVPTIDGGTTSIDKTTPGLFDGVEAGKYRFIAVKRGSVIVSGTGDATDVQQWGIETRLLPLPSGGDVRVAGADGVHHLASEFLHISAAVAGARGVLLANGAIWIANDGSATMFAPG